MASTYSPLKIQLMATGENLGTWGNVTNANLGTAIEEAIVGSADVTFASGNESLTLSNTNSTQTARHLRLNLIGTTGGSTRTLTVPDIEKVYIINNTCADAIQVKNSTGSNIAVPAGKTMWVYSTGTNVVDAVTHLTSLTLASALPVASGGTGATSLNGLTFTGENITNLNASNIASGTLANARTTASSSNGASTIVARDASGDFSANNITANLNGNVTGNVNGNLVGTASNATVLQNARTIAIQDGVTGTATSFDGSANISIPVTAINASVINTGTIANARTTASSSNGANTIVQRDATGNFSANVITANGSAITSLNASNISSGTLANARTTAASANGASTIVARDASGNFSANTVTANLIGTASNATVLQNSRNFEISGGATASAVSFNGSSNVNLSVTALNVATANAGVLAVSRGGTGINAVGTSGNVLTSNGTNWISQAITSLSGTITPTTGSTPYYGARAWVLFNGTLSGSNSPTASGNVSSVVRNGTGLYTINFTTAMPDANYAIQTSPASNSAGGYQNLSSTHIGLYGGGDGSSPVQSKTTTACQITAGNVFSGGAVDILAGMVSFFR